MTAEVAAIAAAWVLTLVLGAWAAFVKKAPPRSDTAAVPDAYRQALAAAMESKATPVVDHQLAARVAALEVPRENGLAARVAALEVTVAGLPSLWTEERQRAEKARERARHHERNARRIAEEGGFDEEPEELPGGDEGGIGAQRMLPLPAAVGQPPEDRLQQARKALIADSLRGR